VEGLNAIPGIRCVKPHGAFYVFPSISGLGLTSEVAASRILDEAGVAVLSGTAFGRFGQGYLRLSYANSLENIEIALERIGGFVKKLGR
jgi:aspartate aminotransferase